MIEKIKIDNFKSIDNLELELKNLTLLTGTNSAGKSTIIQSILFSSDYLDSRILNEYLQSLGDFNDLKNRNLNKKKIIFELISGKKLIVTSINFENMLIKSARGNNILEYGENLFYLEYGKNLFYLSADRIKPREIEPFKNIVEQNEKEFGINGEMLISCYENFKNTPINDNLIQKIDSVSKTLQSQIDYWLKKILDVDITFNTEKISSTYLKTFYKIGDDNLEYKPNNIATGINYLISILILCLSSKKDDVIIIENPEIHLHPKAQSGLSSFLSFVASKGIQLIIETHNDHIINKLCWCVFKKEIDSKDVVIYYKDRDINFEKIEITKDGNFRDSKGDNQFPNGFYEATLNEILEINSQC